MVTSEEDFTSVLFLGASGSGPHSSYSKSADCYYIECEYTHDVSELLEDHESCLHTSTCILDRDVEDQIE